MASELISPNLHVVLIHYPLGLLVAGTFIELFSFLWSRSTVRLAARWMILFGALSAIPATFSGIYALRDIAQRNNPMGEMPWADVKATSPVLSQPKVWEMLWNHALYQSIATGLSVLAVVIWLGCSDYARRMVRGPLILLMLLAITIMLRGAYHGGESIYHHGVGVDTAATGPSTLAEALPVIEIHVIAAGLVVALAMASIGMSLRKITVKHEIIRHMDELSPEQQTAGETAVRTPASSMAMLRSFNPGIELTTKPFAPAARFWLLTGLVAILTAAGGIFLIVQGSDAIAVASKKHVPVVKVIWQDIMPDKAHPVNRSTVHLAAGVVIILGALILAAIIRYGPRQRFLMAVSVMVLLATIGAQVWVGILLLYDTPEGSISRFNGARNVTARAIVP